MDNCEFEACPVKRLVLPATDMWRCGCGCARSMHKNCMIEHNKKITQLIQHGRLSLS